jgi:predicted hotdog family 3-hydroxylacyl-ACP dehydratase
MVEIRGEAIKDLIPQRDPMLMLDTFCNATESEAETRFTITKDALFCCEGIFTEPGLIEHIAQSASAFAGFWAKSTNKPTPLGFIGEVKKCRIHFLPHAGDELCTHICILTEVQGITLLAAETKVNSETVLQCQMKIFVKPS